MENVEQTVISQYANSPTLLALINNMNNYFEVDTDFDNFYKNIWDIDSAVGFGLDIWGRIVGIKREIQIPASIEYFGFSEASPGVGAFNDQPFYSGVSPETTTYSLSDDAYRQLILIKALANISATTAPAINKLLQSLFPGQRCYVIDDGGMMMRYVFEFLLTPYQFAIMTSGALPIPAGVVVSMMDTNLPCFGFAEAGTASAAPFGQAPFISPTAIAVI